MKWEMRNLKYTSADEQVEYDIGTGFVDYVKEKVEEGYNVLFPDSNQLFIDIDCEAQYQIFMAQIGILKRACPGVTWLSKPSSSGLPNRHITVNLPFEITESTRIAFQAAMGSDPARELVNLLRIQHGVDYPTTFVEDPDATPPNPKEKELRDGAWV